MMKEEEMLALRHATVRVVGRKSRSRSEISHLKRIFDKALVEPGGADVRKLRQIIHALPVTDRQQITGTARATHSEIREYRAYRARVA